jgi:hypothetical protein
VLFQSWLPLGAHFVLLGGEGEKLQVDLRAEMEFSVDRGRLSATKCRRLNQRKRRKDFPDLTSPKERVQSVRFSSAVRRSVVAPIGAISLQLKSRLSLILAKSAMD